MTAASTGTLPVSIYAVLDLNILGIIVSKVWILITQEPNKLLDECHKTKLPGVIGWHLIKLVYWVYGQKYELGSLEHFDCPTGISHCYFHSFVYFTTTKQVESSQTV